MKAIADGHILRMARRAFRNEKPRISRIDTDKVNEFRLIPSGMIWMKDDESLGQTFLHKRIFVEKKIVLSLTLMTCPAPLRSLLIRSYP